MTFALRNVALVAHVDHGKTTLVDALLRSTGVFSAHQAVVDRVVRAGMKAILNFAPTQLHVPNDVTVKTVNMAMELEGLSFALTNRD